MRPCALFSYSWPNCCLSAAQFEEAARLNADEVLALDDKDAMAKLGFVDAVADAVGHGRGWLGKVKQGGLFASVLGPPANAKMRPTVTVVPVMVEPDAASLRKLAEDVLASGCSFRLTGCSRLRMRRWPTGREERRIGKVVLPA